MSSRRTVTVLFADMVGSTALGERLDPEALRSVQERYFKALREVVERHGGVVEKFIGDAVMAVFGVPVAHEDDAFRAVRAASELSEALASLSDDLEARRGIRIELRTGVNTGEVITTDDRSGTLATGDAVNTAARLEQAAQPGEILLGPVTFELVRDAISASELDPLVLKGKSEGVRAFRLLGITSAEPRARRNDSSLVGRDRDIALLDERLDRAVDERAPVLLTVLGTAGVGKSRLVREFVERIHDRADVLRGRCLPYGDGITYWPIVEILRDATGMDELDPIDAFRTRLLDLARDGREADRLGAILVALVGASDATVAGDDVSWAVRRTFERLARRRPLVVIVEDIHWAEPALLDILEAVVDWSDDAPLLLVCLARPEVLELRPTWGTGARSANLALEPLAPGLAADLLDALPGGEAIPARVRDRILAVAEGNPLYLEELVSKLIDDGALARSGDEWSWSGDPDRIEMPPTVRALVAARIDGLAPTEQTVAEHASVVGRVFERGAVTALAADGSMESVGGPLLALVRKQLIRPDGSGLDGDDAFRFRHIIIRDVAYERMPKADRAELHERFAVWLQDVLGDRVSEYVEIVAYHLAEALSYRIELDTLEGAGGLALAEQAVARLAEAAERADRLHAYAQAARLWVKAALVARTPIYARAHADARDAAIEFERRAADADASAGNHEAGIDRVRRLIGELGDDERIGRGRLLERLAAYLWELGDEAGTLAAIEEAITLVPDDPPSRDRARVLAGHARFLMLLHRTEESIAVCHAALEAADAVGASVERVSAQVTLGMSLGHLGRVDEAVRLLEESRDLAEEIGDGDGYVRAGANLAVVYGIAGDRIKELEAGRMTIDRLADFGLELSLGGLLVHLNYASGLVYEGRLDEAERAIDRVLELEPSGDTAARAMGLRASVLILRGRHAEAAAVLASARARAARAARQAVLLDLALAEGLNAIQDGRPDDATVFLDEARRTAHEEPDYLIETEYLALRIAADRAVRARRSGDEALESQSIEEARGRRDWIAQFLGSSPVLGRTALHNVPLVEPELGRAEGRPMSGAWREAAADLRDQGFPWDAAYAAFRRAESLHESGADREEVVAALDEAEAAARTIGAEGLVRWVEDVRDATR